MLNAIDAERPDLPEVVNLLPAIPPLYLDRLNALLSQGGRQILGLVGAPGAGKSTVAQALRSAFPQRAQIVPMDGFHLANVELERLGRTRRKGAPDTFDSAGYLALLKRIRAQRADEIIYAPEFRRAIEEPIAGALPIFPRTQLLIAEGNYLLLDEDGWRDVAGLLDEVWYVEVDEALRHERLIRRHQSFGRSPEAARQWVAATDEPNARLIEACRSRADLIFRWPDDPAPPR